MKKQIFTLFIALTAIFASAQKKATKESSYRHFKATTRVFSSTTDEANSRRIGRKPREGRDRRKETKSKE